MFDRAAELEAQGRDIVHLEIGRPHVLSPPAAVAAAAEALESGAVHYTANRGLPELREAIGERAAMSPDRVIVTSGGSEAVACTLMAIVERGDEVIVPTPAWPHYDGHVRLAGGRAVHVACDASDGFQPDPDRIAAAIGPRTRAIVVSSPSNPTGAVFEADRIAALARLCIEHDLLAVSDEIYAAFTYGESHHSIAREPGMAERTIVTDSCSKTWSMTGWRVGWAIAPPRLNPKVNAVHQHIGVCAPSFAQAGAVAAIRAGAATTAGMVESYGRNRELAVGALAAQDDAPARGAFYVFPDVGRPGLAGPLLEEAGVAVVPGEVFGAGYEHHVRVSYAVAEDALAEGLRRTRAFLGETGPTPASD